MEGRGFQSHLETRFLNTAKPQKKKTKKNKKKTRSKPKTECKTVKTDKFGHPSYWVVPRIPGSQISNNQHVDVAKAQSLSKAQ